MKKIGIFKISKIKKLFAAGCAACVCLLSGCSSDDVEGGELIKEARKAYTSLNSAVVTMTNEQTGEVEQTFTFKYDEKDVLMFSYYGKSDSTEYAQYNNGAESFTYDNGKYSHCTRGEDDFVQYTRAVTHPQADEGLLIYDPDCISDASVTEEDGITHIKHVYDVEKIAAQAESGEVTGFEADYYFDGSELQYFVETTTANDGGKETVHSYRVDITQKNAVDRVENTTDRFKDQ